MLSEPKPIQSVKATQSFIVETLNNINKRPMVSRSSCLTLVIFILFLSYNLFLFPAHDLTQTITRSVIIHDVLFKHYYRIIAGQRHVNN